MTNDIELYNANWKAEFDIRQGTFIKTFEEFKPDIQYVRSIAISGLFTKPVLDIDIIFEN